jgi:hypothetical protein
MLSFCVFLAMFAVHAYSCLLVIAAWAGGSGWVSPGVLDTTSTHSMTMNDGICLTTARSVVTTPGGAP